MDKYRTRKLDIYREYSRTYDEDRRLMVGEEVLFERMDWALSGLQIGHRLLDLGCGTGALLLKALTVLGKDDIVYGLDISPDMLAAAVEKLGTRLAKLIEASITDPLPFTSNYFDMVTALNLLQEIPPSHYMRVLRETYRILKPGGWFRVVVPCVMDTDDPNGAFTQEAERLAAMYIRPWREVEELFRGSDFQDIVVSLRSSTASKSAAKGEPKFKLFSQIMEAVKARGLDPSHVQEPVLLLSGRKE